MSSPLILTVLTIILWSSSASFTKFINMPGNGLLYIIITAATLIGFELIVFVERKNFIVPKIREIFSVRGLISSIAFGAFWLLMGLSVSYSSNASVPWAVQYTWPLFATLFYDLFFHNKTVLQGESANRESLKSWLGMLLGFSGIMLLYFAGDPSSLAGDRLGAMLALLAGAAFGLYSAYASNISKEDHMSFLILSCFTGILILIPWSLTEIGSFGQLSLRLIICSVIFGLLVECLASYCWTKASMLIHQQSTKMSSIASLTLFLPFTSIILIYFFFGEEQILQPRFLAGLTLLTAGTALCRR